MSKKKISEKNFRRSTGVKINTVNDLLKKCELRLNRNRI